MILMMFPKIAAVLILLQGTSKIQYCCELFCHERKITDCTDVFSLKYVKKMKKKKSLSYMLEWQTAVVDNWIKHDFAIDDSFYFYDISTLQYCYNWKTYEVDKLEKFN